MNFSIFMVVGCFLYIQFGVKYNIVIYKYQFLILINYYPSLFYLQLRMFFVGYLSFMFIAYDFLLLFLQKQKSLAPIDLTLKEYAFEEILGSSQIIQLNVSLIFYFHKIIVGLFLSFFFFFHNLLAKFLFQIIIFSGIGVTFQISIQLTNHSFLNLFE